MSFQVAPLMQGGPRTPTPPAPLSRVPQLLWRPQTFRVPVLGPTPVSLYPSRSLVVGLEIFADSNNAGRILIGSKSITSAVTSVDGVPGNNYFQLDPGQHCFIWTDAPETETFDVAMYFATQESTLVTQYLHCTQWQAQPVGG